MTPLRDADGFSLVELLVSMSILGIILTAAFSTMITTSRLTDTHTSLAQAEENLRLAHLRIQEIVKQSNYIYPPNITLNIGSATIETGDEGLAVLVPQHPDNAYCQGTASLYCLYAYAVAPQAAVSSVLPSSPRRTGQVLLEWRVDDVEWVAGTVPAQLLTGYSSGENGIIADSLNVANTRLASAVNLETSLVAAGFDKVSLDPFTYANSTAATSLISGLRTELAVSYGQGAKRVDVSQDNYIFSRAIPRGAQPNPN